MSFEAELSSHYAAVARRLRPPPPVRALAEPTLRCWRPPVVRQLYVNTRLADCIARVRTAEILGDARLRLAGVLARLPSTPTIPLIQREVAGAFGLEFDDMVRHDRRIVPAAVRQMAMAMCRGLVENSLAGIGRAFNRDHTCVVRAVRNYTDLIQAVTGVQMPPVAKRDFRRK